MGAQGIDAGKVPGKLRLAQAGVDLAMTDVMQKHGRAALAAFQFRDQVMPALFDGRRDRAVAEGADRIGHGTCSDGSGQA